MLAFLQGQLPFRHALSEEWLMAFFMDNLSLSMLGHDNGGSLEKYLFGKKVLGKTSLDKTDFFMVRFQRTYFCHDPFS